MKAARLGFHLINQAWVSSPLQSTCAFLGMCMCKAHRKHRGNFKTRLGAPSDTWGHSNLEQDYSCNTGQQGNWISTTLLRTAKMLSFLWSRGHAGCQHLHALCCLSLMLGYQRKSVTVPGCLSCLLRLAVGLNFQRMVGWEDRLRTSSFHVFSFL